MKNLRKFSQSTVFGLSFLVFLFPTTAKAATWEEVMTNLNENAETINTCISMANEKFDNDFVNTPIVDEAHTCLDPLLIDLLEQTQIQLNFSNSAFTNYVNASGSFIFDLLALKADNTVSLAEIKGFNFNNLANFQNLSQFEYTLSDEDRKKLEVQYVLATINKALEGNADSSSLVSLQQSLETLRKRNENRRRSFAEFDQIMNELRRLRNEGRPLPTSVDDLIPSDILLLNNTSPQLTIEYESEDGELSVNEGVAEVTLTQRRESSNSGLNFSFGSSTQTITNHEGSLTIKTKARNDRIERTYRDLPLLLRSQTTSITLPEW